jgi:hypothetical protein
VETCRCWPASSEASPVPSSFCPNVAFFEECVKIAIDRNRL